MEIGITKLYKIEDFPHVATLLRGKTELIVYFLLSNDKWDDRKGEGFYIYNEIDEQQLLFLDKDELNRVNDYLKKRYIQSYYIGTYEVTLKIDTDGQTIIFDDPKFNRADRYYRYKADEIMADLETKDFTTAYTVSPELYARLPGLEFIDRFANSFDEIRTAGHRYFEEHSVYPNIFYANKSTYNKIDEEASYNNTKADKADKKYDPKSIYSYLMDGKKADQIEVPSDLGFSLLELSFCADNSLPEEVFHLEYVDTGLNREVENCGIQKRPKALEEFLKSVKKH